MEGDELSIISTLQMRKIKRAETCTRLLGWIIGGGAGKRGVRLKQEIQVGTVRGYVGYEMEKAGTWRSEDTRFLLFLGTSPSAYCPLCYSAVPASHALIIW